MRIWVTLGSAILCLIATATAAQTKQAAPPPLAYDAISIRPNTSINSPTRWRTTEDSFLGNNMTLLMLLVTAYDTRKDLISGLPDWAITAHYDVTAKISEADPAALKRLTPAQRDAMLVTILAERFHLNIHPETHQLPVYNLIPVAAGSKLQPNPTPPAKVFDPTIGGMPAGAFGWSDRDFNGTAVALSTLVSSLASVLQRTVIDRTGLTANYDIHLKWTPEAASLTSDAGSQADPAPPLFTAIQEQLGLKLVPAKGPVQTWVVDHIERPTEN